MSELCEHGVRVLETNLPFCSRCATARSGRRCATVTECDDLRREVERLKNLIGIIQRESLNDLDLISKFNAEIAALKAEVDNLRTFAENYRCYCAQNYPGTKEYHGHDCANVVVQEFVEQWLGRNKL